MSNSNDEKYFYKNFKSVNKKILVELVARKSKVKKDHVNAIMSLLFNKST